MLVSKNPACLAYLGLPKAYFPIWGVSLTPIPTGGVCRSEGFPLTGLFHPWAQWDLGLDTLENSSRRAAAAVVALGGTNLLPTYLPTYQPTCLKSGHTCLKSGPSIPYHTWARAGMVW